MPHRPQSSAGPILQPEISASSLKLLPDTVLGHFHFSPKAEVRLFALRLSTTEFSRKQNNYSHKVICLFLFKFSAYLNHVFSLFDWRLTLIYNNDDSGRVQSWYHFYIIVTCEHQRIRASPEKAGAQGCPPATLSGQLFTALRLMRRLMRRLQAWVL